MKRLISIMLLCLMLVGCGQTKAEAVADSLMKDIKAGNAEHLFKDPEAGSTMQSDISVL